MAQHAEGGLSEMGRRFPSNPHFPQPEGKELEYVKMVLSKDSDSFPQAEGSEGMREIGGSTDEDVNGANSGFTETFSDKINLDDLPPLVRDAASTQIDAEGRHKIILSMLCCQ